VPRVPIISFVVAGYLAGLIVGFRWPDAGSGIAAAILVAAAIYGIASSSRDTRVVAAPVFLASGVLIAAAAEGEAIRCAAEFRHASANVVDTVRAVVESAASPGAFVRTHSIGCGVPVSLFVRAGEAKAGATAIVVGDALRAQRGIVVRDAIVRATGQPPLLARWRNAAGANIDRIFGSDAAIARALLVADTRELSPEVRDRFAVSGLAHILSISGLHVGIIAVAVALLLGVLRVPPRLAPVLSLAIIAIYVAILGAPAPAVRAAVMLGAHLVSRIAQRPTSPWAILSLGAAQPIISPRTVLDLGYQLSVLGVAALIAGGVLVRRLKLPRRPRWRRVLLAGALTSTVATIASAPLVLWYFGRVSVVAPLSNLIAEPIVALLQPMLFFALLLSPFSDAARFVADAAHPLLVALDGVASVTASIPGAALTAWPTPAAAILVALSCASVLVACLSDRPERPALVCCTAIAAMVWIPSLPAGSGMAELHMIDVGQGDAVALRTPRGRWVIFDAGRSWRGGDAGRSTVSPYVAKRGGAGRVDAFVLSHPHSDHVGGASAVIRALEPARYLDAAFATPTVAYRASLEVARKERVHWSRVQPGDSVVVDGVVLSLLAPDSAWTASLSDPNNASVAVLVRVGAVRMLLVGDAEAAEEAWLIARWGDALRADILKVGHHGSSTSSTDAFLDVVRPSLALVSVGALNTYGHPSPSVMRALAEHGAQVLRTDRSGTIVVRTDGSRIFVEAAEVSWELSRGVRPGDRPR
jgi:competence protein ComEC